MIGIIVVSHSRALARAAVDLALGMVPQHRPTVLVAAGLDGDELGTDATAIAAAIEQADGPDGTLVLMDLGSAVLSAEMALELVEPAVAGRTRLCAAPLVEGLVAAVVSAAAGAGLDVCQAEALAALRAKQEHLGGAPGQGRAGDGASSAALAVGADGRDDVRGRADVDGQDDGQEEQARPSRDTTLEWHTRILTPHGLHARPAAALVAAVTGLDARTSLGNAAGRFADAASVTELQRLALEHGDEVFVHVSGVQAAEALAAVQQLFDEDFGEAGVVHEPAELETSTQVGQPMELLELEADTGAYQPGSPEQEVLRLETALAAADGFVEGLAAKAPEAGVTGAVLGAVRAMLHDPSIEKGCREELERGQDAMAAVCTTMGRTIAVFEQMDNDYLRERATDLRSLQRLVVRALLDLDLALPEVPAGRALVLDELDALTAAQLDPEQVPLVLVRSRNTTGHGLIVARDRGLDVELAPEETSLAS